MSPDQDQFSSTSAARDTSPENNEDMPTESPEDYSTCTDFVIVHNMGEKETPEVTEAAEPGHIHSLHPIVSILPPSMRLKLVTYNHVLDPDSIHL